jgi:hypothetical protein
MRPHPPWLQVTSALAVSWGPTPGARAKHGVEVFRRLLGEVGAPTHPLCMEDWRAMQRGERRSEDGRSAAAAAAAAPGAGRAGAAVTGEAAAKQRPKKPKAPKADSNAGRPAAGAGGAGQHPHQQQQQHHQQQRPQSGFGSPPALHMGGTQLTGQAHGRPGGARQDPAAAVDALANGLQHVALAAAGSQPAGSMGGRRRQYVAVPTGGDGGGGRGGVSHFSGHLEPA